MATGRLIRAWAPRPATRSGPHPALPARPWALGFALAASALTGCAADSGATVLLTTAPTPAPAAAPIPSPIPRPVSPDAAPALNPLGAVAEFPAGVSVKTAYLRSDRYRCVAGSVFSSRTAEYGMKMRRVARWPGRYIWRNVDALVGVAESNQMQVHGHTLAWHS